MAEEAIQFQDVIQTEARQGRRVIAVVVESRANSELDTKSLMRTYFGDNSRCLKVTMPKETARVFNLRDFHSTNLGLTLFISTTEELSEVHRMIDNYLLVIRPEQINKAPTRPTDDTGTLIAAAGVTITPSMRQQMGAFQPNIKYLASFIAAQSRFGHEHIRP